MDGGGELTPEQWDQVHAAIKPSIDRLGRIFPSFDALVGITKQAPFLLISLLSAPFPGAWRRACWRSGRSSASDVEV